MKSLFDTKISYYRNVEDNVGTEISLRDFLFCDKYKEQIEHIRSISPSGPLEPSLYRHRQER